MPGYLAGTAIQLRRQTADELAARGRELDEEREMFTAVSVRNERARIASELHDIVGHALSVMVVQAAAGQRLVDRKPEAARASLEAIADSARQGRADLRRLIQLLTGSDVAAPDLALVDEIVSSAARSGLQVTCRFEGDRDGVGETAAHMAFRVVQESLTNALRHAPGAAVRVLVRGDDGGCSLTVRVENDQARAGARRDLIGTGRGLAGLRERVLGAGGTFAAGPTERGWVAGAGAARRQAGRAELAGGCVRAVVSRAVVSLADAAVDAFTQEVGVAVVAGVLLDEVHQHLPQRRDAWTSGRRPRRRGRARRPRTRR